MIKAILLAAGQSKRLKGENKLIKKFKNKPLINHSLTTLIKSKVKKIVIVLGYQNKEIKKIVKKNKKNIFVINKKFGLGMSSSIKVGLRKISKKDNGFIIVQSDMPFIKLVLFFNLLTINLAPTSPLIFLNLLNTEISKPIGLPTLFLNFNACIKFFRLRMEL